MVVLVFIGCGLIWGTSVLVGTLSKRSIISNGTGESLMGLGFIIGVPCLIIGGTGSL
jgi:hypothetical protein